MTNEHWWRALEEQLQDKTIGAGFQLVARLHQFGVAVRLLPIERVEPTMLLLGKPTPGRSSAPQYRYSFRGSLADGHMYAEQWHRLFGFDAPLCGHGMVDVSFVDYDLTGGAL